tara:strand:+ start:59 stop:253 length:195 start_codon:yes stop_codon:yes gene_type:complete
MKVGDLVQYKKDGPTIARHVRNVAVVLEIDDSHRQDVATIMMDNGNIVGHIWTESLEVISEISS